MDALAVSEASAARVESDDFLSTETAEGTVNGAAENKFQKAIAAWRSKHTSAHDTVSALNNFADIDLSSLMPQLDSTASDVVAQQRDALIERKELAQKTKDFRKLEDVAKLTEYKTLLKCWFRA